MKDELPEYVSTFSELAAVLRIDRGHLHQIRRTDGRFPEQTPAGWPCVKVGLLLALRELERMPDVDFQIDRRAGAAELETQLDGGFWQGHEDTIRAVILSMRAKDQTAAREVIEADLLASVTA